MHVKSIEQSNLLLVINVRIVRIFVIHRNGRWWRWWKTTSQSFQDWVSGSSWHWLSRAGRTSSPKPARRPPTRPFGSAWQTVWQRVAVHGEFKPRSDWTGLHHQTLQPGTTWHWHWPCGNVGLTVVKERDYLGAPKYPKVFRILFSLDICCIHM